MERDVKEKIKQTEQFMLMLWMAFLIILFACSFLTEYHFPGERQEMSPGEMVLSDLQKLFFFALMGIGFLIDLVRMRENRNNAFVFLLVTLLLGGFSGGIGAMQFQLISHVMGGG